MAKTITYYSHSLIALMIAALITACGQQKQDAATAMPAMPVSVIDVQPTSIPIRAEAVAQTEGAKEVEVRPRVGGILLKKMFQEGEAIKAGQTMFLIDPVPFQIAVQQAEAQLAQQKARIVQTHREADRLKGLLETQSISQREYDNALSDDSVASATLLQYEALLREAKLNLSYTNVTAPTSGIAGRFQFSEGALVSANTSLLTTIVQLSPIWVRFSLSDSELSALGGQLTSRNVKNIQLVLSDGTEHPESGKLNFSASEIDPALGTQQLRAVFDNANRNLLPGQFVRARITTGTRDGVFVVPQSAVMTGDQGKFVYVAEKDASGKEVATIRPIQEGVWEGKNWVVLGGLNAGDKVIVDNLIKIRPGAAVASHPFGAPPAAAPKTSAKAPTKTSA
jgi:membrane fusion protein, multidrug efflux system